MALPCAQATDGARVAATDEDTDALGYPARRFVKVADEWVCCTLSTKQTADIAGIMPPATPAGIQEARSPWRAPADRGLPEPPFGVGVVATPSNSSLWRRFPRIATGW